VLLNVLEDTTISIFTDHWRRSYCTIVLKCLFC